MVYGLIRNEVFLTLLNLPFCLYQILRKRDRERQNLGSSRKCRKLNTYSITASLILSLLDRKALGIILLKAMHLINRIWKSFSIHLL
jgi:hypothetical protein